MRTVALVGLGLVAGVVGIAGMVWGSGPIVGTMAGALLALVLHLVAAARMRRSMGGELRGLAGAYALGMGLRLLGIGLVVVAFTVRRDVFPAGPTLFGYGAVLVPLLFMEIRFLK